MVVPWMEAREPGSFHVQAPKEPSGEAGVWEMMGDASTISNRGSLDVDNLLFFIWNSPLRMIPKKHRSILHFGWGFVWRSIGIHQIQALYSCVWWCVGVEWSRSWRCAPDWCVCGCGAGFAHDGWFGCWVWVSQWWLGISRIYKSMSDVIHFFGGSVS